MSEQTRSTDSTPIFSDFAGDPNFGELVEIFVAGIPMKIDGLKQAFAADNRQLLQDLAHQLKGAGGGYGFEVVSIIGAELESACKTDDTDTIREKYETAINVLGRISA